MAVGGYAHYEGCPSQVLPWAVQFGFMPLWVSQRAPVQEFRVLRIRVRRRL